MKADKGGVQTEEGREKHEEERAIKERKSKGCDGERAECNGLRKLHKHDRGMDRKPMWPLIGPLLPCQS